MIQYKASVVGRRSPRLFRRSQMKVSIVDKFYVFCLNLTKSFHLSNNWALCCEWVLNYFMVHCPSDHIIPSGRRPLLLNSCCAMEIAKSAECERNRGLSKNGEEDSMKYTFILSNNYVLCRYVTYKITK